MDPAYLALVAAGFGAYWWRHLRPVRGRAPKMSELFDPEAEVAVHVATHEAETRKQPLSSLHLLYGLLQDEATVAAIGSAGGNADELETKVHAALDLEQTATDEAHHVLRRATGSAYQHERRASCVDLWAYLGETEAGALLGPLRRPVLFRLVHGTSEPEIAAVGEVHVVLRNDDYSTKDFVAHVLREVFELPAEQAEARMEATHNQGRAVVGRYPATTARARIEQTRELAREDGFPLWIAVEPP